MISITVITVVFNDAIGLARTLQSVRKVKFFLDKSIFDFNYIVIDGGSTDDTLALISNNCDIVDHWRSEPDRGIFDAMNKGANVAKTNSWLIWINAGDELLKDICSISSVDNDVEVIFSPVITSQGRLLRPNILLPYNESNIFPNTKFMHQGFLIKKESFENLGAYSELVGLQADGYLMSLATLYSKFTVLTKPISIFDLNGISNTRHYRVLISYFSVVRALRMSFFLVVLNNKMYILKMITKIILPNVVNKMLGRVIRFLIR